MKKYAITEEQLNSIVKNTLMEYLQEGRKVLKLGGGNSQPNGMEMPPQPQEPMPPMGQEPMGQPMGDGMPPVDDGMGNPMGDDGATAGQSDFDTNFDAGVEADEDTDPKKYIQQLTGKLSQSLSKYNNENGMDNGLCKYVANMIVKQAAKGLDEKDRKDIIKAINTTQEDNSDEMGDEEDIPQDENDGGEEMPMDDMQQQPQPIQEMVINVGDFRRKILESINPSQEKRTKELPARKNKKNNLPFNGKIFK